MLGKIPLAWLQITREKTRLIIALFGISFANLLMFVQLGLRAALFESAVRFHASLEGDIFLLSPQSVALLAMEQFSERRLYQAMGFSGVDSATPIYIDFARWKNPQTQRPRTIFIIGFNPEDKAFNWLDEHPLVHQLKIPDMVFFDRWSRAEYGPIVNEFEQGKTVTTEVKNRRIFVSGLFELGPSFGADGNLITSDLTFLKIFENQRVKGLIDIGVIKLKDSANVDSVIEAMRLNLDEDVIVLSQKEFREFEINYWNSSTPIGFIFSLGTFLSFIIGTVIMYQVLYSDVSEHLKEYATLKAMGYKDVYLLLVVAQESLILAVLGYLPGWGISWGFYSLINGATFLPIFMTYYRSIMVLILTMIMCSISGFIAVRKLRYADPVDIF